MKRLFTCLVFLGGLALASIVVAGDVKEEAIPEEAILKDRKQIEGQWRIVTLVVDGNKASDEDAERLTVSNNVDGTWRLFSEGKEISRGTSTIDPTKKPKTLDFTVTEGEGKGNRYLGIYELGEQTRKMCFAPPEKERPSELTSRSGSQHICAIFARKEVE